MPMLSSDYPLNNVTDIPIARIACPTCGHPTSPVLPTPATILEHVLKPPPELPSQEVGTKGKFGSQVLILNVEETWCKLIGIVNKLTANLANQVQSIAKVTKAIAHGDLSKQIEVNA
ncbi:hypothetical protein C0989_006676 [Termitomyces sp. Mn162]|nr:hypothetical protein C0989_006676 [Termitomyces sp. Mn162]